MRQSAAPDWQHFQLPSILYWNTVLLLASSGTLELARRRVARDGDAAAVRSGLVLLWLTLGMGLLFVAGQVVAWRDLMAQGLFLATGPSTSFFYVFTVLHALHLLGGVVGAGGGEPAGTGRRRRPRARGAGIRFAVLALHGRALGVSAARPHHRNVGSRRGNVGESQMSMSAAHAATMEPTPFGMTSKKLVMWLFIIADAATFGAMLFAYGYTRASAPTGRAPSRSSRRSSTRMVMTVVLLTSSLTMLQAVAAARRERSRGHREVDVDHDRASARSSPALHLREWFNMFQEGWSLSANPTGGSVQFGATFFSITGLHLAHVISGVVALARDRDDVPQGAAHRRPHRDDGPLLALRRSRLDVRLPADVPPERPLSPTSEP